jgi:cobalt-zinc-cadmium efflux system protein
VTSDKRLGLVLSVNLAMVLGLLLIGLLAHSLGVLAAGADYFGDALGAGLSLVALRMSRRERGFPRATSFAAFANSSLLLLVTLVVMAEAVHRLSSGAPSIHGAPVVLASVVAALAMIACALILGDVGSDLSMQSVMLDTLADAAAAIGVAISGAIILLTKGTYWLDSLVALLIGLVIAYQAIKLLGRALADLREAACPRPPALARPEAKALGRAPADLGASSQPSRRRGVMQPKAHQAATIRLTRVFGSDSGRSRG